MVCCIVGYHQAKRESSESHKKGIEVISGKKKASQKYFRTQATLKAKQ